MREWVSNIKDRKDVLDGKITRLLTRDGRWQVGDVVYLASPYGAKLYGSVRLVKEGMMDLRQARLGTRRKISGQDMGLVEFLSWVYERYRINALNGKKVIYFDVEVVDDGSL